MTRPPLNPFIATLAVLVFGCLILSWFVCNQPINKGPLPADPTEVVVSADRPLLDELMAENAKLQAEVNRLKAEHPDAKITGGGTLTSGRIRVDLSKVRGQNPPSSGPSDPPLSATAPFPPAPEPTPKCAPGQPTDLDGNCLQYFGDPTPIPVDFEVQATILGWEVGTERRVTGVASLSYYDSNNVRHYLGDAPWRADGSKLWVEPKRETRWLLGPMVGIGSNGVVAGIGWVGPPKRLKKLEFRPFLTAMGNQNDGTIAAGMLLGVQR